MCLRDVTYVVQSMPERAQEIGLVIYRGVDSVLWALLVAEIPEIVPRGLRGHKKTH